MLKHLISVFAIVVVCHLCRAADPKACVAKCVAGATPTDSTCCFYDPTNKYPSDCCDSTGGQCTLNGTCCNAGTKCGVSCCGDGEKCSGTAEDLGATCVPDQCKKMNRTCTYGFQKCCGGICGGNTPSVTADKIQCCSDARGQPIPGSFCTAPQECGTDGKCVNSACVNPTTFKDNCAGTVNTVCCGQPGSGTGKCCPTGSECCATKGVQNGGCCPPGFQCAATGAGCEVKPSGRVAAPWMLYQRA